MSDNKQPSKANKSSKPFDKLAALMQATLETDKGENPEKLKALLEGTKEQVLKDSEE